MQRVGTSGTHKLKQPILCATTDGTCAVDKGYDPASANGPALNGTSAPAHDGNNMNGRSWFSVE